MLVAYNATELRFDLQQYMIAIGLQCFPTNLRVHAAHATRLLRLSFSPRGKPLRPLCCRQPVYGVPPQVNFNIKLTKNHQV